MNNEGVQRPDAWNQIKTWPCVNDVVFVFDTQLVH